MGVNAAERHPSVPCVFGLCPRFRAESDRDTNAENSRSSIILWSESRLEVYTKSWSLFLQRRISMAQQRVARWEADLDEELQYVDLNLAIGNYGQNGVYDDGDVQTIGRSLL